MLKRVFSLFLCLVLLVSAVPVEVFADGSDGGNIIVGGACVHGGLQHEDAVAAQCTQGGSLEYWYCPDCDTYWLDSDLTEVTAKDALATSALGHSWGGWEVSKAASCTEDGQETRKCGSCGETESRAVAATGHKWSAWETTTAPTCTLEGVSTRTCETCKAAETKAIPATGAHVFGNWEVSKAATCTAAGEEIRSCACGEKEIREIAALGHSWGDWAVKTPATCTAEGTEARLCGNCALEETRKIAKLGHVDADKNSRCDTCGGETGAPSIDPVGSEFNPDKLILGKEVVHNLLAYNSGYWYYWTAEANGTIVVEASGESLVSEMVNLTREDARHIIDQVAGFGSVNITHTMEVKAGDQVTVWIGTRDENAPDAPPASTVTFQASFEEEKVCTHSWSDWNTTKEATCVAAGEAERKCSLCGVSETKVLEATGVHTYGGWEVTKAATCTETGEETRKCGSCDAFETQAIAALGHKWGNWEETKAPTCTLEGVETKTCATCGGTETRAIPATGVHTFGNWEVTKAATCTEKGEETRACACGEKETREIAALGHKWGEWETTTAPTCTVDGVSTKTCATCKATETQAIPATGEHVFGNWEVTKAATCTEKGEETRKCGCGKAETREIAALGHKWGEWETTTAPTCTVDGVSTKTCATCKATETQAIPATGEHVFGNWEVTKAATCTEKGEETRKCGCGETETREIAALGHKWGEWVTTQAPTCTVDGVSTKTCANCNETETQAIPATGEHVFGNWEVTKAATCTEKGEETRKCGCGKTETREIAALGHKWGQWETTTAPTCTVDGVSTKTCETCKATETQAIPATGEHVFGNWEVSKAATCTEKGEEVRKCGCGETETREIAALGHKWGQWETTTAPTCTVDGVSTRTCANCNGTETQAIPATGEHVFGNWEVTKAATCTEKGEEVRKCGCGKSETREIAALGHKWGEWETTTAPTCTVDGVSTKTCATCKATETQAIPATGEHVFGNWEVTKAATCTEKGEETRKCGCGKSETREIAALGHKDETADGLCDSCGQELTLGTEENPLILQSGLVVTKEFEEGDAGVYYRWTAPEDGIFALTLTGDNASLTAVSDGLNPGAADLADKEAVLSGGESLTWAVKAGETVTLCLSGVGTVSLEPGFTAQSHEVGSLYNPLVVEELTEGVEISVAPGETFYLNVQQVWGTWMDAFAWEGIRFLLDGTEQAAEDGIVSVAIGKDAVCLAVENHSQRSYNTQLSFEYMEGHFYNPVQLKLGAQDVNLTAQEFFGRHFTWTAPADGKFTFHIESLNGQDLWEYQIWSTGAGDPAHNAEEDPLVDTVTWDVEEGMVLTIHIFGYGYTPDKVSLPGNFRIETSFEEETDVPPVDPNVIASGSCGENAAWVLDINGLLTVSGQGNVETAPWMEHSDKILTLAVEEGIEGLGDDSFRGCSSLGTVTLPDSLKTIGDHCFDGCSSLETLKLPAGVETIGEDAFAGCDKLTLTVTPDSPAEAYAAEHGIPYNYPPKAEGLAIVLNGEDVTGQTLRVDMKYDPTLTLSTMVLPEGAEEEITWKVSDSKLASVEDGTVTFKKPGTVTVTASVSGTKIKAAVKLDVIYLTDEKLYVGAAYPAEGLQEGYSAYVRTMAGPETALLAKDLEYTSSDEEMATVDEMGCIIAGSKAGTVTITAAIKGDPLNRKASFKVKIIAKQTHELRLVPMADDIAEIVMLDSDGNVTEYYDRCAHFVLYIDKADVASGTWSFQILPNATGEKGEDVPVNEKSLKWSTSDKRIATVKADKTTGFGIVTVKAKTDGACTVKAVSNDLRKVEAYITIHVREYTPRLEKTSLTMNDHQIAPVTVGLVEGYGNKVKEVSLHEYDSKSKSYLEEASQLFGVTYADSQLSIRRTESVKNGTYKLLLKALCENGETYEYKLSLKVTRSLPSVTVKQMGKFNLFYKDSVAQFQLTTKSGDLTGAEWAGNDAFRSEYDAETGILTLYYSENAKAAEGKVSSKGTIAFYFSDYHVPVEKAVTVKTEKKAPKLTMDPAVSVVNTALNGEAYAKVYVWPFFDESMSVHAEAPFAEIMGNANMVRLTLKENKGGTAYLYVKCDNWMESVKLTHKVTVQSKLPTVNTLPKITLNRVFTEQVQTVEVALNQSNLQIASMTLEPTAKSETVRAETQKIWFECYKNFLSVHLDENDLPKNGSYEFRLTVTLEDGTVLAPKTFKVTVESKVPAVKLKSTALKLNRDLEGIAYAETQVILPKGYENFAVVDMVPESVSEAFRIRYNAETGMLRAELLEDSAKGETVKLYPVVKDLATGQQVQLEKAVSVKLTVYAAKPAVVLSAKGKLDTIVPDSAIVYTIKKLNNIAGVPEAVRLEGEGADLFRTQLTEDGSRVILTLKDGSAAQKGKTYKLQLVFTISGQEVAAKVSVKVNQSAMKFQSVKTLNLYQSNARLGCVLEVKAPEGASVADITLNPKTAKQFIQAVGGEDAVTFTELPDGRVLISFKVKNPGYLTWGKTYSVYLDVTPEGNAENAKPVTVKLTVKTFK